MAEYIKKQKLLNGTKAYKDDSGVVRTRKLDFRNYIESLPTVDVVEIEGAFKKNVIDLKEMILDFIEDNRPTDVQTDWERGCAYICDEIEKLLK